MHTRLMSLVFGASLLAMGSAPAFAPALRAEEISDCAELAISIGAETAWLGHVSGRGGDTYMWAQKRCFATEAACRKWLLQSFPGTKTASVLSCRRIALTVEQKSRNS